MVFAEAPALPLSQVTDLHVTRKRGLELFRLSLSRIDDDSLGACCLKTDPLLRQSDIDWFLSRPWY